MISIWVRGEGVRDNHLVANDSQVSDEKCANERIGLHRSLCASALRPRLQSANLCLLSLRDEGAFCIFISSSEERQEI
jgi:hypothetical protein